MRKKPRKHGCCETIKTVLFLYPSDENSSSEFQCVFKPMYLFFKLQTFKLVMLKSFPGFLFCHKNGSFMCAHSPLEVPNILTEDQCSEGQSEHTVAVNAMKMWM